MKALWASLVIVTLSTVVLVNVQAKTVLPDPTVIFLHDEFAPEIQNQTQLTLGDLAKQIISPNPELQEKLRNVFIMELPDPGEHKPLSKSHILLSMRKAGINNVSENIRLEGESVLQIYGHGYSVSIQTMVAFIQQQIIKETGWLEDQIVMRVLSTPAHDIWLPSRNYEMNIKRVRNTILGSSQYYVQFFVNQILVDEAKFIVTVEKKSKVFMPTRDVQRGEVILEDDIKEMVVLLDDERIESQVVRDKEDIIGQRVRYTLKKNDPIKFRYLETNYILRRGDLVRVILQTDGLTLQTSGYVQERAAPGDIIKVKAAQTGKILDAKVINKNIVELM